MNGLGIPIGDGNNMSNDFATIPDVPLDAIAGRVVPRQVQSGVQRGTQTIMNTDGSYVTLGLVPDNSGDFGIAFFNSSGNLISKSTSTTDFKYASDGTLILKVTGVTEYRYDKSTGRNYYQNGLLPDGSYGEAIAKAPYNIGDAITP